MILTYLAVALVVWLLAVGTFLTPGRPRKPVLFGYGLAALAWPAVVGVVLFKCGLEHQHFYRRRLT